MTRKKYLLMGLFFAVSIAIPMTLEYKSVPIGILSGIIVMSFFYWRQKGVKTCANCEVMVSSDSTYCQSCAEKSGASNQNKQVSGTPRKRLEGLLLVVVSTICWGMVASVILLVFVPPARPIVSKILTFAFKLLP
jgi:hypothetical protein